MSEQAQIVEQTKQTTSVNKVTDYSLGIFGTSDNFLMAMQMAKALAASTIVPRDYQNNPSNCLIAIEQAQRKNVSPLQIMQNLYCIQGRPSWSSSYLIAMINQSKKYDTDLRFDEKNDEKGKPFSCVAWAMKNGERIEGMVVDMNIANAEGWTSKNGSKWKTMPQLMLRYRAASFFARLNCPEVTLGFYSVEESIEMPEEIHVDAIDLSNPFANVPQFQKPAEIPQSFEVPVNPFPKAEKATVEEGDGQTAMNFEETAVGANQ